MYNEEIYMIVIELILILDPNNKATADATNSTFLF